jgi:hypothetical protein
MRNAILRASCLFLAAALAAGCALAGQTQTATVSGPLDPKDFQYKSEPGDPSKGELKRNLIIYRPTQQVLLVAADYKDGRTVTQQFRVGINNTIERESEYYPHPTRPGWQYERRRTLYDARGRVVVTRFYRADGSLEKEVIGPTPYLPPKPDPDKKPR